MDIEHIHNRVLQSFSKELFAYHVETNKLSLLRILNRRKMSVGRSTFYLYRLLCELLFEFIETGFVSLPILATTLLAPQIPPLPSLSALLSFPLVTAYILCLFYVNFQPIKRVGLDCYQNKFDEWETLREAWLNCHYLGVLNKIRELFIPLVFLLLEFLMVFPCYFQILYPPFKTILKPSY